MMIKTTKNSNKPPMNYYLNIAAEAIYQASGGIIPSNPRYKDLLEIYQRINAIMREEAGIDKPKG